MTASEQRWKNRDDQAVMVGFIGSVAHAHRENTSRWKHVTLVMTGIEESLKAGRSLLLECGKFLVE